MNDDAAVGGEEPPAILPRVDLSSIEFWEWFYDSGVDWSSKTPGQRRRDMEERWHPELVLNQDPAVPGTGGEFRRLRGAPGGQPRTV